MAAGERQWRRPPRWIPGDLFDHARLNIVSDCLEYLKDALDGKIPIATLRCGREEDLPAVAEPGEVYFAIDTERLFVRAKDRWVYFEPSGYR